jgi:Ca2+/Na+ antiporter
MGSFLWRFFIDPAALPQDAYGVIQLLFLGMVYGVVLMHGSTMIKDGSELLLLVPALAGVVGSVVLPVLGAVPDGAIVLFSGLGSDAQRQVAVGIGALAGSTVMLLTVAWVLCVIGGRVNVNPDGSLNYKRRNDGTERSDWKKLDPPGRFRGTAVRCSAVIGYNARVMLLTLASFAVVQIPAIVKHCASTTTIVECNSPPWAAITGAVVASMLFCCYLWDQARIANRDDVKECRIDELRKRAIDNGMITLRALLPAVPMDGEGQITIDSDNRRFRDFLRPFFRRYDTNNNGGIEREELRQLMRDLGENPTKETLEALFQEADTDGNGKISFSEFAMVMARVLTRDMVLRSQATRSKTTFVDDPTQPLLSANKAEYAPPPRDDETDEDEEEEPAVPEDLAELPPKDQQRRVLLRSLTLMTAGTLLVLVFSAPVVGVLSEIGYRSGIKPFFVAFVLAPIASNAPELIASFGYSQKKAERAMTISLSSLIGAVCMNNTFCLALFLYLIFLKSLKWEYTAETTCIVVAEVAMFFVAARRVQPVWTCWVVAALYPAAIGVVVAMEAAGLD